MIQESQNNRLAVGGQILELLGSSFPNLKREDHEHCISSLYQNLETKESFNTSISDYLVMLDIQTNQELA